MTIDDLKSNIKRITAEERSNVPFGQDRAEYVKRSTQLSVERVALWRELWQRDPKQADQLSNELFH